MKLFGFSTILSTLYTDKLSVFRYIEKENEDGTVSSELSLQPVLADKPCRISFTSTDNPETTKEDSNPVYLQIKVFCEAGLDIKKGDTVEAHRLDDNGNILKSYKGTANLPLQYVTHKEFLLVETGDA